MPTDRWERRLHGTPVVLDRTGGQISLRVSEVTRVVASPSEVHWVRQANGMARLCLLDGDAIAASVVYFGGDPWGVPPEVDFTWTESEDFDFGEFTSRIIRQTLAGDGSPGISTARAALRALGAPVREADLGPLGRLATAGLDPTAAREVDDRTIADFIEGLEDARTEPGEQPEWPPVMPLALGLRDRERELLLAFATRWARRAVVADDPQLLTTAAVAIVLGGLDCDRTSLSFRGAWLAMGRLTWAIAAFGLEVDPALRAARERVGQIGAWRLGSFGTPPTARVR